MATQIIPEQFTAGRDYFQSLVEHANDLITVVDECGIVLYQSPASDRILGVPAESCVGRNVLDFIEESHRARAAQMLQELLGAKVRTERGEFLVRDVRGASRTLEVVASRLPFDGSRRRLVLNSRDLTERRDAEQAVRLRDEQLRQAQKMEAVGRLAGGIAHDFSNLLTVITGACERLRDLIPQSECAEEVETILRNCNRAASLTRQLLTFSRQQSLNLGPLDIAALAESTADLLRQLIGEHIDLVVDIRDRAAIIEADRVQMEQVLMNLAINARDAMPGGGVLRMRLRKVLVGGENAARYQSVPAGAYAHLEVSDTGVGMDAATQARAFDPFFTTKPAARGTGLGLSTVYGIVQQTRGHVWVDSREGQGTTFHIVLPLSARPASREADRPRPAAAPGAGTILLTEDEPDVRRLLRTMLTMRGYSVIEASGPAEALSLASDASLRIDLLVTDVVMRGGTGHDLARVLRAGRPELKVLMMSGYPDSGGETGEMGANDVPFLPKPFSRDMLFEAVERLLTAS